MALHARVADIEALINNATNGALKKAMRQSTPLQAALAEATRAELAVVVAVLVAAVVLVAVPLCCYVFTTFIATEDELDDLNGHWWFRFYVRYGRCLQRWLPCKSRRPPRATAAANLRANERATLLQDAGVLATSDASATTRRRNVSSC